MKEQMARHYNEQAYNDASQQTKDHRQLHQTDSSMRRLMSMPRKVQRSIWRMNMRCPTYSQVTIGQRLRCRWCDEDYNSITEHVVVYPLPWPLLVGGVRCSRLWSTSQLLRPSGQQCSHSGGVCPQIQGRQCGAYVGAVEEMMCVVCVDVTEGA